jgi:hypothetical protein
MIEQLKNGWNLLLFSFNNYCLTNCSVFAYKISDSEKKARDIGIGAWAPLIKICKETKLEIMRPNKGVRATSSQRPKEAFGNEGIVGRRKHEEERERDDVWPREAVAQRSGTSWPTSQPTRKHDAERFLHFNQNLNFWLSIARLAPLHAAPFDHSLRKQKI